MPDKDPNAWMNDQLRARAGKTINRSDEAGKEIADALRYERTTHVVTRPPSSTSGASASADEEGDQDAHRPAS